MQLARLCLLLVACGLGLPAAEGPSALADPPGDPLTTPLPAGKPWEPGWCRWDWRAGWLGQHQAMLERNRQGGIDVVFLGDSITAGWTDAKGGKPVWDQRFAPLAAVNYGIGGDSTRQILWRIGHGVLTGIAPRLVVVAIGTNNLYDDANGGSDEEIARGIATVVSQVRAAAPPAKVLLLGLLPRQNEWFCGRVARINALIAPLGDGRSVHVADLGAGFADAPGKVKAALYDPDQLHLSPQGYAHWGEVLAPLITRLLTP